MHVSDDQYHFNDRGASCNAVRKHCAYPCRQALSERVQLASKREQSLQEREAAVAAREEEVTNVERNLREGMRQSRWGAATSFVKHQVPTKGYVRYVLITERKCR